MFPNFPRTAHQTLLLLCSGYSPQDAELVSQGWKLWFVQAVHVACGRGVCLVHMWCVVVVCVQCTCGVWLHVVVVFPRLFGVVWGWF